MMALDTGKTSKNFSEMTFRSGASFNFNDYVTAFAALNYAHGWLDAGARIGVFDVNHDSKLFTVD